MENTTRIKLVGLALLGASALMTSNVMAAKSVHIGGQAQFDYASFQADAELGTSGVSSTTYPDTYNSSAEVRRADLYLKGELEQCWSYQVQWDAANSQLSDTWIGYAGLKPFWVAIGHVAVPFGMDHWSSSSSTTFLEKASLVDAFAPDDGIGAYLEGNYDMFNYAFSVVLPAHGETGKASADRLTAGARVTFAPKLHDAILTHFGVSGFHTDFDRNETFSADSRPEVSVRNTPNLIASIPGTAGVTNRADGAYAWGAELAAQLGSLLFQSEYQHYTVNADHNAVDLDFDGWYAQLSYVLTGEARTYDKQSGTFGRVSPHAYTGAWEIAMRYSDLDVSDTGRGWTEATNSKRGEMKNWSAGINWYATDHVKFALNYIHAHADYKVTASEDRDLDIMAVRAQLRF